MQKGSTLEFWRLGDEMPRRKRNFTVITQVYNGNITNIKYGTERVNFSAIRRGCEPVLIWRVEGLQGAHRWTADDEAWLKKELEHHRNASPEQKRRIKMHAYHHAFDGTLKESESRRAIVRSLGKLALAVGVGATILWVILVAYSIFTNGSLFPSVAVAVAAMICFFVGFAILRCTQYTEAWCKKVCTKQLRYNVLWSELSTEP